MKYILIILGFLQLATIVQAKKNNTDSLKNVITNAPVDSIKIKALIELVDYLPEYNPESAIAYSKQLIAMGKKDKDKHAEAYGLAGLSYCYYNEGDYDLALEIQLQSLGLIEEGHDTVSICEFYNNLGNIYKGQTDNKKAIIYYQKCYRLATLKRDKVHLLYAMMNLGYVYDQLNLLDSALMYSNAGLELGLPLHYDDENSYIMGNLGNIYAKMPGKGHDALNWYGQSLKMAANYPKGMAMTCIYLDRKST